MKIPSLAAAFAIASIASASAITDADIAPAALAGKTLTFTIVNGTAPFATNGTWTGTFAAAGSSGFTVANVAGDTVNIAATQTGTTTKTGFTEITLDKFIEGRSSAVLTLYYDMAGVGKYEVFINGLFGANVSGTFTIGTNAPPVAPPIPPVVVVPVVPPVSPEVEVQQPAGSGLTDGSTKKSFGTVKVGKTGKSRIFTIKNTGTADLTGLSIRKDGARKSDFIIGKLGATRLAPGATTTFKVSFKPTAKGTRKAAIHISSNDENEASFDIQLAGEGAKG